MVKKRATVARKSSTRAAAAKSTSSRPKRQAAPKAVSSKSTVASDWRDELLEQFRKLILKADPKVVEERKWAKASNPSGVPVWSSDGIICTGETYKQVVKLTFAKGASLPDPLGLFNSSLDGNTRRAIDFHEGEKLPVKGLKALIAAAIKQNSPAGPFTARATKKAASAKPKATASSTGGGKRATKKVVLLSGGNPQITKGTGEEPVQAYIAAMPGWKRELGEKLDALITNVVPDVHKAIKWNSPFYGVPDQGFFLGMHCFAKYVKVAFFHGISLKPLPPGASKSPTVRYLDIHEQDKWDQPQLTDWISQAASLPGWKPGNTP